MKLTFEEACSAVADLFEACPEMWTNDDWLRSDKFCVVTGVKAALDENELPLSAHGILYGVAVSLGYRFIADANQTREDGIRLLRIAAGEIKQ